MAHRSDNPDEKWCVVGKHFAHYSQFAMNRSKWDGLQGSCRLHDNERTRQQHREKRREQRTGMPQEEYDRLYAEQQGCCAGCGQHQEVLCADHNHATGKPRGLLCSKCNMAAGLVNDDPNTLQRLADYLRR